MSDHDLILASASPRRSQLLEQIGVRFKTEPADIDEMRHANEPVVDYVSRMAFEKAHKISQNHPENTPVLGADTIVLCDGDVFTKPENYEHARAMLLALSDNCHQVLTSVALVRKESSQVLVSTSQVWFRTITETECLNYWCTGEPKDKAGAYAIQGYGAVFVKKIEGSFSGVVGLPLAETSELLSQFNVPIWGGLRELVATV